MPAKSLTRLRSQRKFASLTIAVIALVGAVATTDAAAMPSASKFKLKNPAANLAQLNKIRAKIGERQITMNSTWSKACSLHERYMYVNRELTHEEKSGRRGYSKAGKEAGLNSVLTSKGGELFSSSNNLGAWADAPFHQLQIFNPMLARTGMSQGCMNTLMGLVQADIPDDEIVNTTPGTFPPTNMDPPPDPRLAVSKIVSYPYDGASNVARAVVTCYELPREPFTVVGWGCDGTGTVLYVYGVNDAMTACPNENPSVKVTLTGPKGALTSKIVEPKIRSFTCGWIVVTKKPLPRKAKITMDVTIDGVSSSVSFTSG